MTRSVLSICVIFVIFFFVTNTVGDEAASVDEKNTDVDDGARAKRQTSFGDYGNGGSDGNNRGGCGGRRNQGNNNNGDDNSDSNAAVFSRKDKLTNKNGSNQSRNSTNNRGPNGRGGKGGSQQQQRRRGSIAGPEFQQVPLASIPSSGEMDSPPKPVPRSNEGGKDKNMKNLASQLTDSDE